AHINARHGAQIRDDEEIDLIAGIRDAEIDLALLDDEPPFVGPPRIFTESWSVGVIELDDCAFRWKLVRIDTQADVPHQEIDIELVPCDSVAYPAPAHRREEVEDREPRTRRRRGIIPDSPAFPIAHAHDECESLEVLEPLRQQRLRHARHTAPYLVETSRAVEQVTQDQKRPA